MVRSQTPKLLKKDPLMLRAYHSITLLNGLTCDSSADLIMQSHISYIKGRRDEMKLPPESVPSSLCPSVRSSMRIDTLEAPRLPAAHHPSTESDTVAFCPPRMGRKLHIVKDVGMKWSFPSIHSSRHPSKQNKYIFLKGKKLEKNKIQKYTFTIRNFFLNT